MRKRALVWMVLLSLGTILSGCSTVYHAKWRKAAAKPTTNEPVGAWEGRWTSGVNGHNGKLRCIISDSPEGGYDFHFWARWQIFAGTYHLQPEVIHEGESFRFQGTKNLGRLVGGEYSFDGRVNGDSFAATYKSRLDNGRFELMRHSE